MEKETVGLEGAWDIFFEEWEKKIEVFNWAAKKYSLASFGLWGGLRDLQEYIFFCTMPSFLSLRWKMFFNAHAFVLIRF